jgi:carbonic anhydrase
VTVTVTSPTSELVPSPTEYSKLAVPAKFALGVKVIYVLGHTSCGAVAAAAKAEPVPGQISALFQHIRPAIRAAKGDPVLAVRENVRIQAQTLVEGSTVIASLVSAGSVLVAGGIFDLETGRVEPVDLGDAEMRR